MNKKQKTSRIQLVLKFSKNTRKSFLIIMAAFLISTILNAFIPRVFSFTIDQVLVEDGIPYLKSHLWILALIVVGIAVGNGIATFLYRMHTSKAGETFAENMRNMLFYHVQRLPMSWHNKNNTGDIIQRCTADVETIRTFVITQVLEVFRTLFLIIISLIMMFQMNVKLTLIALIFIPVIIIYSAVFYHLIARNFQKADEAEGELSTVVQENATGVRVVRSFGREEFEIDRFDEKNKYFAKLWIRLGTVSGLYWGVGDLIAGFQVMFIVIFGAIEAVHGNITPGEFVAFASYNTTLVWPIRALGRVLSEMSKTGVSFDRVNYILDSAEEELKPDGVRPENLDIVFDHVTFAYEKNMNALEDVSIQINKGQTVGILGGTGSGKSTLVHLLERLYLADSGKITIGGENLTEISGEWLHSNIGIVLQEPFLYSRTIKENIAAARPDASMEEIRAAAKVACIDDAIMSFADGYDTIVGERGITLSGGQRQRIAIARMLLCNYPILIFDDSLSAVDAETDYLIRTALREKMKHASVILISHRINTLMEAEKIVVLKHGKVEEEGTHEELITKNGTYQKIYEIQMNQDDRALMEELN